MNLLKTYFKVLEKIILEPLGKEILKHDTQKSFDYFIQCKDNQKAWQVFDIFLNGTIMELIRICCAEADDTPTPYDILEWLSTLENLILLLISELTLNIGLGIYVNRVGEGNNDYRCSQAGRMKCIQKKKKKKNATKHSC